MCLITNKKKQIAAEDIVVYKVLSSDLRSPYQCFQYEYGTEYTTEITTTTDETDICCFCSLDENHLSQNYPGWRYDLPEDLECYKNGFHSISEVALEQLKEEDFFDDIVSNGEKLFQCIIPKGSTYVEDFVGFIVSSSIIIVKDA